YVEASRIIVKQRHYISKNPGSTRKRNFKFYPGENVVVTKTTSLKAAVSGRVKYTYDPEKERFYANVLPEPREELLREDLWRYRTEFITSIEDNKLLVQLRQKAYWLIFPRPLVNPPQGIRVSQRRICLKYDEWNNPCIRDPLIIEPHPYPLKGEQLKKHLKGELQVTDPRAHEFIGESAQR
ncbi:hypothetical protein FOZ63_033142, partial [Perkinsus olseni]